VAIGTRAEAGFDGSVAIGAGATTTRANQVVVGNSTQSVTIPGLAPEGQFVGNANQTGETRLLSTDSAGNIGTTDFDPGKQEDAIRSLGDAVTAAGALATAFSAVPSVVVDEREVVVCGAGLGSYGSTFSGALGCAIRPVPDSALSFNVGLALVNSVDYGYGKTPGYAGRVGFSVPLGIRHKSKPKEMASAADPRIEELQQQLAQLRSQLAQVVETPGTSNQQSSNPGQGRYGVGSSNPQGTYLPASHQR
jgi:hypothetical protein